MFPLNCDGVSRRVYSSQVAQIRVAHAVRLDAMQYNIHNILESPGSSTTPAFCSKFFIKNFILIPLLPIFWEDYSPLISLCQWVMIFIYAMIHTTKPLTCYPLLGSSKIGDTQILKAVQISFTSRIHGFQHLDHWHPHSLY